MQEREKVGRILRREEPAVGNRRGKEAGEQENGLVGFAVRQTPPELGAGKVRHTRQDGIGGNRGITQLEGLQHVHREERRGKVDGKIPRQREAKKTAKVRVTKGQ